MKLLSSFPAILTGVLLVSSARGDEKSGGDPMDSTNWRKWAPDPAPFLEPAESAKSFKVAPGFRIELVAAHPMIKDPVFAEFDLQGRLWVCEFQSYMMDAVGSNSNDPISRVQVLEDTDGDGRMDKATTFLDKVVNPRSLSIVQGGALVALGNGKLVFCEDTDGDLVADRQTPLIDYAASAPKNIEHAENGLHHAIDNWMYNAKSERRLRWSVGKIVSEPTKSRGQWGMDSDAYGRLYYNSNSVWFFTDSEIYDSLYGSSKAPTRNVWAIRVNTALNRAYEPDMIQEDGRINGVTSVSGLAVHSNGAFGREWEGAIFSFDPGTNTVGAFRPDAPMPQTTQYEHVLYPDDTWTEREFIASTDERFRPVNGFFGPDGCLYIVDLNRGIIQDKRFLTRYLQRQSEERELDEHIGKGRIWRVVPESYKRETAPAGLVEGLSHPYLWWRLKSQKRIVEENRDDLVPAIVKLAASGNPKGKVHAMWTLAGLGKLDPEVIERGLGDDDWFVKLTALRLAGEAAGQPKVFPERFASAAKALAGDGTDLLASYAGGLSTKGYPDRSSSVYKDKAPRWVSEDKDLKKTYLSGRVIFGEYCAACHQPDGKGLEGVAPGLVKSDWVTGDPDVLIAVAMHGLAGPIQVNGKAVGGVPPIMPPHHFLDDRQMADILTYVRNAWGNKADAISADEIKDYRGKHADREEPWTQEELRGR